jgi:type IV pilus assembly protein PilX
MKHLNRNTPGMKHQQGAALVVGLLLLVVITLLAIGGMNSASVDLVMAGNTQYQQRAFQAAEMGIERTMTDANFIPGPNTDETVDPTNVPGLNPDTFRTTLTSDLDGAEQPAIWGNNIRTFSTYHFQLSSIGESARNARTTHTQGVAVLAPKSGNQTPPGDPDDVGMVLE